MRKPAQEATWRSSSKNQAPTLGSMEVSQGSTESVSFFSQPSSLVPGIDPPATVLVVCLAGPMTSTGALVPMSTATGGGVGKNFAQRGDLVVQVIRFVWICREYVGTAAIKSPVS